MMEAACTSETSVDIYLTTRQYIPEESELNNEKICKVLIRLFSLHVATCPIVFGNNSLPLREYT
jgi:hypothetical protein